MKDFEPWLRRWRYDLNNYGKNNVKIINKSGRENKFELNKPQKYIDERIEAQREEKGFVRVIILKGRQQGASKYCCLRNLRNTTIYTNVHAYVMAHDSDTTSSLFEDYKRLYNSLPDIKILKPTAKRSNAKELVFEEISSSIRIGTAGSEEVGRGMTLNRFHGCLSADSMIVLSDGSLVSMGDISEGDMVVTSSGAVAPVKNKFYTGEKQTYSLECWVSGDAIHLTEDHKVLTIDGYKKLSDMCLNDFVAMPCIKAKGRIKNYSYDLMNPERYHGGGTKHTEFHNFQLDYDFGYFLGNYLADGHIKKDMSNISLCCHVDEKEYTHKAIKSVIGMCNTPKHDVREKRYITTIHDKFLASAVNELVGRVENKHVPEWFFDCDEEFLDGVLNGYLDGDGSKTDDSKIVASSIHQRIAYQMQRICFALYGAASIKHSERWRYDVQTKDIYTLRLSGNPLKRYKRIEEGKRKEKSMVKDGVVYCRVKSITPRKIEPVFDIEVDHPDHNYQTTTGIVSNSETAFWKNGDKILAGVLQAIPSGIHGKNTEIILESTANGVGNKFYRLCMQAMRGEGDFELIFIPWWWTDEYRIYNQSFEATDEEWEYYDTYISKDIPDEEEGLACLAWRRNKIFELGENKFKQEYPSTPHEAFQMSGAALFKPEWVKCAQDTNIVEDKSKPLVVGVDAAEAGGDRTVILFRRGNKVLGYNKYDEMDEMRLAGIVNKIILDMKPAKVFFDKAYANGCVQRLHELGHAGIAKAIPFGSGAIEPERFANKRAEMHWLAKEWLQDGYVEYDQETGQGGVDIPVDDAFAADLACVPEPQPTSNGKIKMVEKSKIKEEYGMSPDILDAFVLTFAEPVARFHADEIKVKHKSPTDIMYGR